MEVPKSIRFKPRGTNLDTTIPKSTGTGKSGGGGGGGGGSKDHTPTEHTPKEDTTDKKLDDAADAQKEAAEAAKEAFEQEKKNAEDLINITYMDWIERLLNVIDKKVNQWTKTIDRVFSYWNKNWAINKTIQQNRASIMAQSKAYNYYMKQANKAAKKAGMTVESDDEAMTYQIIGGEALAKSYKNKTANGAWSIEEFNETKNSKKLQKKIQAYIEW